MEEIRNYIDGEEECLDMVRGVNPSLMDKLIPCYTESLSCLRRIKKDSSIVCTAEEQEAKMGL